MFEAFLTHHCGGAVDIAISSATIYELSHLHQEEREVIENSYDIHFFDSTCTQARDSAAIRANIFNLGVDHDDIRVAFSTISSHFRERLSSYYDGNA